MRIRRRRRGRKESEEREGSARAGESMSGERRGEDGNRQPAVALTELDF